MGDCGKGFSVTSWQANPRLFRMAEAEKDLKAIFEEGCRLFNEGDYFEAHEVWEELWNLADGPRHAYLQGLIQVAAGLVHSQRGNWNGVRKLFSTALSYLEKGRGAEQAGEVDPEALKDAMVEFELALREKLAGTERELPYFKLPRLPANM
jgi:uncharacterized protein